MCDCEVAVIMFTPDGELAQFSTSSMEDMLRRYSRTCVDLHETQTREGMLKRAAATAEAKAAANGGGALADGGPAKKRMKEDSKSAGRGVGRMHNFDANDSDTAEAILSMQGLPPLAPAPEIPSQDMDVEFNKLIAERAKRAQQLAANAAGGDTAIARHPSGSASERDGEAGPGPSSAFLAAFTAGAAAAGGTTAAAPASAIDSLADLLKGGDASPLPVSAVKSDPSDSPHHAAPTAQDVDTPTVAPGPPVAGTVELPAMLGPNGGEQAEGQ